MTDISEEQYDYFVTHKVVRNAKLLLSILGATAAPITAFSALQILRVITTLLPRELRPPLWRKIALVLTALFYGAISFAMIHQIFSR